MVDDTIFLFCGTPNCFQKEVQIADLGVEVSANRSGCPVCSSPLQFGEKPADIGQLNDLEELEPDWFLTFTPERVANSIGTLASRCTTFVVTARTLHEIAIATGEDNVIVHKDAIIRTEENLMKYRKMIEETERNLQSEGYRGTDSRLQTGDKLSPGFPKDEDSARRHSRNLLGGDSKSGRITQDGLLSKLGIINVESDDPSRIKIHEEVGKKLLDIEMPHESVTTITVNKANRFSDLIVPQYYTEDDSAKLAKLITKYAEAERKLMQRTLRWLSNKGGNPPHLGQLADREVGFCEDGQDDPVKYWMPLKISPKDSEGGMTVFRETPDDILDDEWRLMEKKVLSGMSVAMGRMRELRLVFGVREGRHVKFFINDVKEAGEIGKKLLKYWDDQDSGESDV